MNLNELKTQLEELGYNPELNNKDGYKNRLFIRKKDAFRLIIYEAYDGKFSIQLNLKTKFGGYKYAYGLSGTYEYGLSGTYEYLKLVEIVKVCFAKYPEVKTTEKRFDPRQLVQNIMAVEIMAKIKNSRVKSWAKKEDETCDFFGYSFGLCSIGKNRTIVRYSGPQGHEYNRKFEYDITHPSFDPSKLINIIIACSKKMEYVRMVMSGAWSDIAAEWHEGEQDESK